MRLALLALFLPPFVFAACPVGVNLADLSTPTNSPPFTLCVANSQSTTGYCTATCGVNGSCASYGSAGNYKAGPFITTGAECQGSDSGGSNGSDSGSGSNSGSGTNTGTNSIKFGKNLYSTSGLYDGQTVGSLNWIGSGLETGLNIINDNVVASKNVISENMSKVTDALTKNTNAFSSMTSNMSGITSGVNTLASNVAGTQILLKNIDDSIKSLSSSSAGSGPSQLEKDYMEKMQMLLYSVALDTSSINQKIQSGSSGGSSGGNSGSSGGTIDDFPKSTYWDSLLNGVSSTSGMMQSAMSMWGSTSGNTSSINSQMGSIQGYLGTIQGNTSSMPSYLGQIAGNTSSMPSYLGQIAGNTSALNGQLNELNGKLDGVLDALANQASGGTGTGGGHGNGSTVGTADNPAHVASSAYKTACNGAECFFSTSEANQQLATIKEQYQQAVRDIQDDFKGLFDVKFDGSADYLKCFDFYNIFGKGKEVCIDSEEYFNILQALMMFLYAMIAFYAFMRFN